MKRYFYLLSVLAISCNTTVNPNPEPTPVTIETIDVSGKILNWDSNKTGKAKLKWSALIGNTVNKQFGDLKSDSVIPTSGSLTRVLPSLGTSSALVGRFAKTDLVGCQDLTVDNSARIVRVFDEIYSNTDVKAGLVLQSSSTPEKTGIESPNYNSKSTAYFYSSVKTTLLAKCLNTNYTYELTLETGWNQVAMLVGAQVAGQPKSYRFVNENPIQAREWFLFGDIGLL
jgi:hypothetical protein